MKRQGGREVWSVAEVTGALSRRFEDVPAVWVEAEIQDISRRRGQVRFRLVGDHSISGSMNAVVFDRLAHRPTDGTMVQVNGRVQFYARTATISMRVERMDLAGDGLLRARVAELMAKLRSEGLLDPDRKRPLPLLPRRIGVVTSASGAARHDIERTVARRHPGAGIVLVDSPVQGDGAPAAIVRALAYLDDMDDVEVIIVARGGGSLEDLMAFNDERVCRSIAGCRTPVVSAVGHESDTTLSDAVADARASTPTGAAELVAPDAAVLADRLDSASSAMLRSLGRVHAAGRERLASRSRGLVVGLQAVGRRGEDRVEGLSARLTTAVHRRSDEAPRRVEEGAGALGRAARARLERAAGELERSEGLLGVLSPERTVRRGYVIARGPKGRVISEAGAVAPGDELDLQFADGRVAATAAGAQ